MKERRDGDEDGEEKSFVLIITVITGSLESDHEEDAAQRTPAGRRVATADAFLATLRVVAPRPLQSAARDAVAGASPRQGVNSGFPRSLRPPPWPFSFLPPFLPPFRRSRCPSRSFLLSASFSFSHLFSPISSLCSSGTLLRMWRGRRIARIYSILFLAHWRRTGGPMKVSSPLASFSVKSSNKLEERANFFHLTTSNDLEEKKTIVIRRANFLLRMFNVRNAPQLLSQLIV